MDLNLNQIVRDIAKAKAREEFREAIKKRSEELFALEIERVLAFLDVSSISPLREGDVFTVPDPNNPGLANRYFVQSVTPIDLYPGRQPSQEPVTETLANERVDYASDKTEELTEAPSASEIDEIIETDNALIDNSVKEFVDDSVKKRAFEIYNLGRRSIPVESAWHIVSFVGKIERKKLAQKLNIAEGTIYALKNGRKSPELFIAFHNGKFPTYFGAEEKFSEHEALKRQLFKEEKTIIEEPPAFVEEQLPVYKSVVTLPVSTPKPREPIPEEVWDAIDVNKVQKRGFSAEEREEILAMDLKGEKMAIIARAFATDIPSIHKVLISGLANRENPLVHRDEPF
jgi:hypothetical protein